ncbi:hypothetical protein STEG23_020584 [Scotinomys teguina]
MSAVMLLPGTNDSLLLVQRTVTRTIVLQETIGKGNDEGFLMFHLLLGRPSLSFHFLSCPEFDYCLPSIPFECVFFFDSRAFRELTLNKSTMQEFQSSLETDLSIVFIHYTRGAKTYVKENRQIGARTFGKL